MKNVTLSIDEELARWVRIKAAEADVSMSRYVSDLLRALKEQSVSYDLAKQRFLARKPSKISADGAYPGRDEIYDRPVFRR